VALVVPSAVEQVAQALLLVARELASVASAAEHRDTAEQLVVEHQDTAEQLVVEHQDTAEQRESYQAQENHPAPLAQADQKSAALDLA
jgi:hypothetical protein